MFFEMELNLCVQTKCQMETTCDFMVFRIYSRPCKNLQLQQCSVRDVNV